MTDEYLPPNERLRKKFHIKNASLRNALSEFFGTALLLFIGLGIVMQFILSNEKLNTWIQVNIGWGFAIAFCVYATSQTSDRVFSNVNRREENLHKDLRVTSAFSRIFTAITLPVFAQWAGYTQIRVAKSS
uniref:Cation_ATPase_C domain-containing protein n=1 Tax=Heterorhabditis bacteriophora TaxID=37862 RepID=A0A1I7XPM9_HETBA